MNLFHQDIKHLCEFWDFSKKDKQKNDDWRLHITKNQKSNWPTKRKLRQKQLASDQENNIYLLEEDGFDGKPVFDGTWNAIKKYLEPTNWPSSNETFRCSGFFHLNIIQTLLLCIKSSFEKGLKELPEVYDFVRIDNESIKTLTSTFLKNIDNLKFKIDLREFRNTEELFIFFKDYYQIDIEIDEFKSLIRQILEKNIHLHSIFDKEAFEFINTTNYGIIKDMGADKEKAVLVVLKVKYTDRKLELQDKINELNRLAEEYGIMIEEWRDSIGVSYNYYKNTCELVDNLKNSDTKINGQALINKLKNLSESIVSNNRNNIHGLEGNITRIYEASGYKGSLLNLENIKPGQSIITFSDDKKNNKLSSFADDLINGNTISDKITFLEKEIKELDKNIDSIINEITLIKTNPESKMVRQHMQNKKFYNQQFLAEALNNIETVIEQTGSQEHFTKLKAEIQKRTKP